MRHMSEAEYSCVFIWLWWFAIGYFAAVQAPVEENNIWIFPRWSRDVVSQLLVPRHSLETPQVRGRGPRGGAVGGKWLCSIGSGERQRTVWIASIEISCSHFSEMHEDVQDRCDLWTVSVANVFLFVLEMFVALIIVAWFQLRTWKCTICGCKVRHCYCRATLFKTRSNPVRSLTLSSTWFKSQSQICKYKVYDLAWDYRHTTKARGLVLGCGISRCWMSHDKYHQ